MDGEVNNRTARIAQGVKRDETDAGDEQHNTNKTDAGDRQTKRKGLTQTRQTRQTRQT